jgi:hypothetical protein
MAKEKQKSLKFRPERPIVLSTENTGFRTEDELAEAVEKLRTAGWLATTTNPHAGKPGAKLRPLHMSFNDVREFQEFKKECSDFGIKLKEPLVKPEDLDEMEAEDTAGQVVPGADAKESYEDTSGKIHISDR